MAYVARPARPLPATLSAPHVRDTMCVRTVMKVFWLALIPPTLMAVYNTGYQANLAMERLGVSAAPGWRGQLIEFLGTGYHASEPLAAVVHGAVYFLPVLLVAVVAAGIWTALFSAVRRRPAGPGVFGVALVVTLLLPPTIPLWLTALGMSFGIVFGREIFGGFGRNVLNPAVVTLAFLHVTYPAEMIGGRVWVPVDGYVGPGPLDLVHQGGLTALAEDGVTWMDAFLGYIPGTFGETSALACILGAVILLWMGLASWRIIAGVAIGVLAATMLFGAGSDGTTSIFGLSWMWHIVLGSTFFGAVYIATDPVTAASTDTGRWIYGILIGLLNILIRVAAPVHADGMVFAILLGNIFAPAIDHGVTWVNIRRRKQRNA